MAARPLGMPGEDDAEGDGESLSRGSSVIRLDPPTDRGIVNPRPCNGWQVKHRGGISGSSDSPLAAQQGLDSLVRVLKRNNPRSSHLWTHRCGYGGPCRHMASHDDAGHATSGHLFSCVGGCISPSVPSTPDTDFDYEAMYCTKRGSDGVRPSARPLSGQFIRPCVVRFCLYPC